MINQVNYEGFLTSAWEYREQRTIRLAKAHLGEDGQSANVVRRLLRRKERSSQ